MSLDAALLSLSGLSVGDAFGQSFYFPEARKKIDHRELKPPIWYWTEDTQLALSVVEELRLRGWIDQDYLARRTAWRYVTDPARGYGSTTTQVLNRIAQGEYFRTVSRSVFTVGSYGCSGAARTAPLGAYFSDLPAKAAREAPLATAITHTHPEALAGAQAVAIAAAIAANPNHSSGADFLNEVLGYIVESQVRQGIEQTISIPKDDLEHCLNCFTGDNLSTVQTAVPFALWCAAHHLDNYKEALWLTVAGMGPRDTTCSIVGGIVALSCGAVPIDWIACREPIPSGILLSDIDRPLGNQVVRQETPTINLFSQQKNGSAGAPISVRVDPLTGSPNILELLDRVDQFVEKPYGFPFSLVAVQLVPLSGINRDAGRTVGDNYIRHCAQMLQKLEFGSVFRIGGDKFAILLEEGPQMIDQAYQIAHLMNEPKYRLSRTTLIHFPYKEEAINGRLLACLHEALSDNYYKNNDGLPCEFDAPDMRGAPGFSWMMVDLSNQMQRLAQMFDEVERLAQTDVISQLPNLRSAMTTLEASMKQANYAQTPLSILLLDGDNLRRYNDISYEAGDEAIRLLGSTLRGQIHVTDFLARWRTGDEFLIILPDTPLSEAVQIGRRICTAVERASKSWLLPTTISAGIASYPLHGPTLQDLLHAAEEGLDKAKESGKNQAVVVKIQQS